MFNAFYSALLLLLFCLIIRGVVIEYRNKFQKPTWKKFWDVAFFISSFLDAFLIGVAFANIFAGIPIDANGIYHRTFGSLLRPYAILGGIFFVFCFAMHGANWIALKNKNHLGERSSKVSKIFWAITLILAGSFLIGSYISTDLWKNFAKHYILLIFPAISVIGLLLIPACLFVKRYVYAWICSSLAILGFSAWAFAELFPKMLPSSLNPAWTLTCFNSSSSLLTLKIMTMVAFIFVPIVLIYTSWAYKIFAFNKK